MVETQGVTAQQVIGLDIVDWLGLLRAYPAVDPGSLGKQSQHNRRRWCRRRAFVPWHLLRMGKEVQTDLPLDAGIHQHTNDREQRYSRNAFGGRVSKVEMTTLMTLIGKVFFPFISTFETRPAIHVSLGCPAHWTGVRHCGLRGDQTAVEDTDGGLEGSAGDALAAIRWSRRADRRTFPSSSRNGSATYSKLCGIL